MANTRFATESGVHVVVEGLIGAEAGGRGEREGRGGGLGGRGSSGAGSGQPAS
jgi:hypothetical protein